MSFIYDHAQADVIDCQRFKLEAVAAAERHLDHFGDFATPKYVVAARDVGRQRWYAAYYDTELNLYGIVIYKMNDALNNFIIRPNIL